MSKRSRKFRRRAYWIVLGFCLVNLAWSYVGTWWIEFGGVRQQGPATASRCSGVYSEDGHLVLAALWSHPPLGPMSPPLRQVITRWNIGVEANVGPAYGRASHNTIYEFRRQTEFGHGFSRLDTTAVWQASLYGPWLQRGVAIPWWMISGVVAAIGAVGFARERRRRRRIAAGLCAMCGYDVRASPHRCPECGTACI